MGGATVCRWARSRLSVAAQPAPLGLERKSVAGGKKGSVLCDACEAHQGECEAAEMSSQGIASVGKATIKCFARQAAPAE